MQEAGEIDVGGRPSKNGKTGHTTLPVFKLEELGLSKMQSLRFQRIASIPQERFEEIVVTR